MTSHEQHKMLRDMARSREGYECIILHTLGYKMGEQAALTREQKIYIQEAFIYFQERNASGIEDGDKGEKKVAGLKHNMEEVKRQVRQSG